MKKKIIFVLHNGHHVDELSYDCEIRLRAASLMARKNQDAAVCFVGGGGISGSAVMKNFWKRGYPELKNRLEIMSKINNTADAFKRIAEYVADLAEGGKVSIISSAYHVRRMRFFKKKFGLKADIVAAEDVLMTDKKFKKEIEGYRNSSIYHLKRIAEFFISIYASLDQNQKLVRIFRGYIRNKISKL